MDWHSIPLTPIQTLGEVIIASTPYRRRYTTDHYFEIPAFHEATAWQERQTGEPNLMHVPLAN